MDAGRRLLERAEPALTEALAAMSEVPAQPGEPVVWLPANHPRGTVSYVIESLLPEFSEPNPRMNVEIVVEARRGVSLRRGPRAG
jgi:DNA-binding transcriptional LysR family regulator